MRTFKNYNFGTTQVTALVTDEISPQYVYIAFEKNSDGVCILRSVSASNLEQIYSEVEISTDRINKLWLEGNFIYSAIDDDDLLGYRIYKVNLLGATIPFTKPSSVIENAIEVIVYDNNVYFLTPGIATGEPVKIIKTSITGTLDEIIELEESANQIKNAIGFTIDNNGDIWVVTNDSIASLVRVYEDSGGMYTFDTFNLE